jgi:hypothetical protein
MARIGGGNGGAKGGVTSPRGPPAGGAKVFSPKAGTASSAPRDRTIEIVMNRMVRCRRYLFPCS